MVKDSLIFFERIAAARHTLKPFRTCVRIKNLNTDSLSHKRYSAIWTNRYTVLLMIRPFELKLFKDVIETRYPDIHFIYANTYDECHSQLEELKSVPVSVYSGSLRT